MIIKPSIVNFLIVWAFILIGRFLANAGAAVFADNSFGKALAVIAA